MLILIKLVGLTQLIANYLKNTNGFVFNLLPENRLVAVELVPSGFLV